MLNYGVSAQDYYRQIHKTLGVLVLYPGDRYYTRASSSSVATAISAGVPLVVEPRFLQVYDFMPQGPDVLAEPANHAVAIKKMLALTADEYLALVTMVSANMPTCPVIKRENDSLDTSDSCARLYVHSV